jgi:beta-N-acetylhexosaminidase
MRLWIFGLFQVCMSMGCNTEANTLDKMIGQMLLVGFDGTSAADYGVRTVSNQIHNGEVGGVIWFARNVQGPSQVLALNDHFRAHEPSDMPTLIAIDQEGGEVQRLKMKNGFSDYKSHKVVAAEQTPLSSQNYYEKLAQELSNFGFNLNLGPVVDVDVNPLSPAIGVRGRSFSQDADEVYQHARSFILAHQKYGLLTSIKHFPGHGSALKDSHFGFTDVTKTWLETELDPYRLLIADDILDSVMVAHVFNSKLDAKNPASLSKSTIQDKLQSELGFKGVVISDCLQMKALAGSYSFDEIVLGAIRAGNHILVFSNYNEIGDDIPKRVRTLVLNQIARGDTELKARVETAYHKIVSLKQKLGLPFTSLGHPQASNAHH